MAWIETIDEEAATGRLAKLYAQLIDPESGHVDNILKVHSIEPNGLTAHLSVYKHVMRGTASMPRAEREMVAVVVSAINGCRY